MAQPFSIVAAAFTPFDASGAVAASRIAAQVAGLVADGVDGAFICGTTGEGSSLTREERMDVASEWVLRAPKGFRVIVHVGHAAPAEARILAGHAQEVGAHSVSSVAPYFLKPRNATEVVDAIATIAAGAPELPFYYYHVPMVTGVAVPAAAVVREARARIPNFRGVKFTDGDLNDLGEVIDACGSELEVFYGRDDFLLPAVALGVRQAVGMTYNYTGPLVRQLVAAFDRGDMAGARAAQAPIRRLIASSLPYGLINGLKGLAPMVGVDCGPARPPLSNLAASDLEKIAAACGIREALASTTQARKAA